MRKLLASLGLAVLASSVGAPLALAAVGDVDALGICTGGASASLKLQPDAKKALTKYTLTFRFPGETKKWNYSVRDNGVLVTAGQRTVGPPAFGFNVAGTRARTTGHTITAFLVDVQNRNSCSVEASI